MAIETPQGSLNKKEVELTGHSSLKEIGAILQKARLDQNIPTKEFADSLRIGEGQLRALEIGEEDDLPEPVFIRGMIRRIAEKLGLNSNSLVDKLERYPNQDLKK